MQVLINPIMPVKHLSTFLEFMSDYNKLFPDNGDCVDQEKTIMWYNDNLFLFKIILSGVNIQTKMYGGGSPYDDKRVEFIKNCSMHLIYTALERTNEDYFIEFTDLVEPIIKHINELKKKAEDEKKQQELPT